MKKLYLILIPLLLSGITHLWNPVGFPDIFFDEGVYMRRTLNILQEGSPQEAYFYDHPYFGQLTLAGFLATVGYPDSLNATSEADSLKMLYMIPRIFMGMLAILDTFLIYKITEKKYGKNVAFISSVLFAVMPFSWIFRRILLDSLLLPFLLSSILVALYAKDLSNKRSLILASGILLGLGIFTKIPAFVFIPLIAGLVFYNRKKFSDLGLWFLPVILIPMIWPAYAMHLEHFDLWMKDVFWQAGREGGGLALISQFFLETDPMLFILGMGGIVFAAYKRDYFILSWSIPMILFLGLIGFTQYFHSIPLIPVFCIGGAILVVSLLNKLKGKIETKTILVVVGFSIFGLASLFPLIMSDVSSSQFKAMSFVLNFESDNQITILSSPVYSWVFDDVFNKDNVMMDYAMILFEDPPTEDLLLIADSHFLVDISRGQQLEQVYSKTKIVETFDSRVSDFDPMLYPYGSMRVNYEGNNIEIRTFYGND